MTDPWVLLITIFSSDVEVRTEGFYEGTANSWNSWVETVGVQDGEVAFLGFRL